jgi:hypothetical protein
MALAFIAGATVSSIVIVGFGRWDAPQAALQKATGHADPATVSVAGSTASDAGMVAREAAARTPAVSATGPGAETAGSEIERVQRTQIATLQARVRELERKATDPVPGAKFHDFTDAELQAMARNCEVRFDLPRISREPFHLSPDQGARLHLSDAEQERVMAAVDAASRDVIAHLRAFYLEATGDVSGVDSLDPQSLMHEILDKSPPAALQAARAEIARERAGLPPSPTGSIAERYLRYMTTAGDSLQRALDPVLGAQQSAVVRDALRQSISMMSGCAR